MKKITTLSFLFSFCALLLISSCKEDPIPGCTDPDSENYNSLATEDDGSCFLAREKFLGTYQANENCALGNFNWNMTVTESTAAINTIIMANFGDYGENVVGTVNGSNLTINDTKNGITFSGTGTIAGNSLTVIYTASAGGLTDDCTATCIKQ